MIKEKRKSKRYTQDKKNDRKNCLNKLAIFLSFFI